jgi:hypothetical protein
LRVFLWNGIYDTRYTIPDDITMPKHKTSRSRLKWAKSYGGLSLSLLALYQTPLHAQSVGISSQGVTGGLVIPSAHVLVTGSFALSYGNYQEPQLGVARTDQNNLSFGIGLLPGFEFFGRFANYTDPRPNSILFTGARDLSANVKLQLPLPWASVPKVAVGVNDLSGGAVFFKSGYMVASEQYGPLGVTLGYAKGSAGVTAKPTFDGVFGGLDWRLGDTGLTVLAEYDGQQKHAGVRWQSAPLASLARARVVGTAQRSFGAVTPLGVDADSSRLALSLVIPLGDNESRLADFKPATSQALPALDAKPAPGGFQPTADDRLASLRKALGSAGLERVRVGLREGMAGQVLVVEYENHRYAHNEADALGIVFGLGSEMAPAGTQRVQVVTFKGGLRLYESAVDLAAYRNFLRDGPASQVRDTFTWDRLPPDQADSTRWLDVEPTSPWRVRVELKPDLNYTVGTEVGAFDYALAADVRLNVPLWTGGQLTTGATLPLANSSNMEPGAPFDVLRQRSGLKTVMLQQSFWLGNRVLAQVGGGRFHYDTLGVQGQAVVFVPGSDHTLHLRGAAYRDAPGGLAGGDRAFAASYRHMLTPAMALEAGVHRFSDGSTGPSVEWTRWFGDVGVQIFYRKGGSRQFAGLEMSIPLTPRQGMMPGPVFFTGAGHYENQVRTALTTSGAALNYVRPGAVRNINLETSLDNDLLNAGRVSRRYFSEQVYRMREAFFKFGHTQLAP